MEIKRGKTKKWKYFIYYKNLIYKYGIGSANK
jgi:hypothetical protein